VLDLKLLEFCWVRLEEGVKEEAFKFLLKGVAYDITDIEGVKRIV
jgi:hypothetical protein